MTAKEPQVYQNIRVCVYGLSRAKRISMEEVAMCTGAIQRSTLYERLRNPAEFRLGELICIAKKLGLTLEQLLEYGENV